MLNFIQMKKKTTLNKKLFLNKTIVANLSQDQLQQLLGGAVIRTTRQDTCATIPPGGRVCQQCA